MEAYLSIINWQLIVSKGWGLSKLNDWRSLEHVTRMKSVVSQV